VSTSIRPSALLSRLGRARFPLAAPTWPGSVPRPAPERRIGLDYDHEWSRRYPVRLARAVVLDNVTRPAARLVAPTTVRGMEHLELAEPPVILAANHASHLDTPLLLTTLPVALRHRTVVAAASDYFFDRTWKSVLWSFALAAVPIERSRVNRRSLDTAAEMLDDGWNLVIFPEGGRSPDGWAQPFSPASAAYLAGRTGRPVVPVHLSGTRHVLPRAAEVSRESGGQPTGGSGTESRLRRGVRRSPVTVVFGEPLTMGEGEDARRFGARIETAVAMLADEVATDWWTARRRAAQGTTPSPRGPAAAPWRRAWALEPAPGTEPLAPGPPPWPDV
jgi:1-acyl-sn-glycerol-3-phosphate acyltransferase